MSDHRNTRQTVSACIELDDLAEFVAASYLDCAVTIAAYLIGIVATGDAGLLTAALIDIRISPIPHPR